MGSGGNIDSGSSDKIGMVVEVDVFAVAVAMVGKEKNCKPSTGALNCMISYHNGLENLLDLARRHTAFFGECLQSLHL